MAVVMPEERGERAVQRPGPAGVRPRRVTGLVLQLELKQAQLEKDNTAFAKLLGVSRNYWYRLRSGDRDPSLAFTQRVLRRWPGEFEHCLPELVMFRASGARRGSAS